jgi:hypothetical protein
MSSKQIKIWTKAILISFEALQHYSTGDTEGNNKRSVRLADTAAEIRIGRFSNTSSGPL